MFYLPRLPASVGVLLASVLTLAPLAADAAKVTVRDSRVTLSARNESLAEVLEQLAGAAGFVVDSRIALDGDTTLSLRNQSLPRALKRLLGDVNHILLWDEGQPVRLILYPGQGDQPVALATPVKDPSLEDLETLDETPPPDAEEANDFVLVLADPDASRVEKAQALRELSKRGDVEALGALVHALDLVDNAGIKMGVIRALGRSGSDVAVDALAQVVEGDMPMAQKVAAARALKDINSPMATAVLERVAAQEGPIGNVGRQALGR